MDQKQPERYQPAPQEGLTTEQVRQRVEQELTNRQENGQTRTISSIIRNNLFTFFNLMNLVLATCLLLVGSYRNLLFMGVVVSNIVIGIIQEIRAKRTIDKLSLISAPVAQVVRGGVLETVAVDQLVLDDIVQLSAGNQICADAVVVQGNVEVNESLITGESDSIAKQPGDSLLSGSFVVSGTCRARLEHVGAESYAARITADAKRHKKPNSELMNALNKIIRGVGIGIIPVGLLLFFKQWLLLKLPLQEAVPSTVAALIGMIPEGLVLLTSVAMAIGVIRLGRYKTLVQELYCIETLARVDVLCLDKTGTITEGDMLVKETVPLEPDAPVQDALGALAACLQDDNATFRAIREAFAPNKEWVCTKTVPFSSQRKWSGASFESRGAYIIGAPEFILRERYGEIRARVEEYSAQGNRVLLLARQQSPLEEEAAPDAQCLALVLLADKIRPEAPETFRFFQEQGVGIKIISGDNPLTVAEVARRSGVADAGDFVDASTLTTDEAVAEAATRYTVFGRVTPPQKRILVKALKAAGHTVAMTGDGVNDVLALKDADCSVAMASGSDAARHVAQLVLLDSNFSSMPRVVMEGRRVINNIERSASLFLVKTIYSAVLSLIFLFLAAQYPFVPIQLTLISALTIGFPSFVLALEPNKRRVQGRFLTNVLGKAVPGALTIVANILIIMALSAAFQMSSDQSSTIATISTGFIGLLVLFRVCMPFDWKRKALWGAMVAAFFCAVVFFHELFFLYRFGLDELFLLLGLMAVSYPVMIGISRLQRRVSAFHARRRNEWGNKFQKFRRFWRRGK